jgi:hypothetical protein
MSGIEKPIVNIRRLEVVEKPQIQMIIPSNIEQIIAKTPQPTPNIPS